MHENHVVHKKNVNGWTTVQTFFFLERQRIFSQHYLFEYSINNDTLAIFKSSKRHKSFSPFCCPSSRHFIIFDASTKETMTYHGLLLILSLPTIEYQKQALSLSWQRQFRHHSNIWWSLFYALIWRCLIQNATLHHKIS